MRKVRKNPKGVRTGRTPTPLNKDGGAAKEARERSLDETLAETFPASDPLSSDPDPIPPDEQAKVAS